MHRHATGRDRPWWQATWPVPTLKQHGLKAHVNLYMGLVILNILDIGTTLAGLSLGAAEANPLHASAGIPVPWLIVVKVLALALLGMLVPRVKTRHESWFVLVALLAGFIFYTGVVGHNLAVIGLVIT